MSKKRDSPPNTRNLSGDASYRGVIATKLVKIVEIERRVMDFLFDLGLFGEAIW